MKNNNKGFTLVEMIVTLVIISVLNAVAIFGVKAYLNLSTENILEAMCTLLNETRYEALSNGCKETHITFEKQGKKYVATIYKDNKVFKQEVVGSAKTHIYCADNDIYAHLTDKDIIYYPVTQVFSLESFKKLAAGKGGNMKDNSLIYSIKRKSVTFYFNNDGSLEDIAKGNKKLSDLTDGNNTEFETRLRNFEIVGLTGKQDGGLILSVSVPTGKAYIADTIFGRDDGDAVRCQKSYGVLHNNSEK